MGLGKSMNKTQEPKNRFYLRDFDRLKDISFSSNEIINLVLRKTIPIKSYIRKSGTDSWISLMNVPEISKVLNKSLKSEGPTNLSNRLKTYRIPMVVIALFFLPYYMVYKVGYKGLLYSSQKMTYIGWKNPGLKLAQKLIDEKKKRDELAKKTEVKYPDPREVAEKVLENYKSVIVCDPDINKIRTGNRLEKNIYGYLKYVPELRGSELNLKSQNFSKEKILGYPGKTYVGHGSDLSSIIVLLEIYKEKNTVGYLIGASFCEDSWKKAEIEDLDWWRTVSPDEISAIDGGDNVVRSASRKKADIMMNKLALSLSEKQKEKLFNMSSYDKLMKNGSIFKKSKSEWSMKDSEIDLEISTILNDDLMGSIFNKRQHSNEYYYNFRDITFESIELPSTRNFKNKFISFQTSECPLIAFGGDVNTPYIQVKLGGFEKETPWGNRVLIGEKIIKLKPQIIKGQSQAESLKNKILKNCGQIAVKSKN